MTSGWHPSSFALPSFVGKFYYTQDREPTAIDKFTAGESDSTIGDRAKKVNTYREIVVYNEDQASGKCGIRAISPDREVLGLVT